MLPRGFRLASILVVPTILPVIAFVRPVAAQPTIGLYADAAGTSCSLTGNSPGLITTYVVVRPDENGVRAVQFAAPIPSCLGATFVGDNVPAGMLSIGSSPSGIHIALQSCNFGVVNVLQIVYLGSGNTTPCCEFSLVPDPSEGEFVAVSCAYQELPLTSVASHFNADASCACVGNSAPRKPDFPSPYEYATGVSVGTAFGWEASDPDGNLAEFDVYLGTTPTPPLVAAELTVPSYTPALPLTPLAQHYWRVVARDALGLEASSATWTFTTRAANSPPNPPQNPAPENATLGVSLTGVTLRWQAFDLDGDPLVYDVYFGTTTPPPLVANDWAFTSYPLGSLSFDTVYYWRIVARDTAEQETAGPIWWFETRPENFPPNSPGLVAPANNALGVSVTPTLSWTVSDIDPGPLVSDVYFGTSPTPPLVASDVSATTYAPGTLSFSTHYYWKIVVRDQPGAETEGATWDFTTRPANYPPVVPFAPSPANGAYYPSNLVTLSWQCSDPDGHALTYDVYFGTTSSPPLAASDLATRSYNPGTLSFDVVYWWKVVARDALGAETAGPVWTFEVSANQPPNIPSNPSPAINAVARSINTYLLWQCSDPNGQPLTFDVYFGTTSPPALVATNIPSKSYFPGPLAFETQYYWRIVARDTGGLERSGSEWNFSTRANSAPSAPSEPSPPNHGVAPPAPVLTWACTDVDLQPLTFDVYFGTTSPPPLAGSGLTVRSFAPGTLPLGRYFWRVVASDGQLSTSGPTWDFDVALLGDADLDGTITLQDASCALGSYIQVGPCTMGGPVADVNCSGAVTPADARCIHKHVLNGSCTFCGEPAPGFQAPLVSVSNTWESDDTLYVRLMVSGVPSLRAFGFSVDTQASLMRAVRRGATADFVELRARSPSLIYYYTVPGAVGGYSLSGAPASEPVEFIELSFYASFWSNPYVLISMFVDDLAGAYPLGFYLGGGSLPVLITRFDAAAVDGGVEVRWELRSDEAVESFTLYRREEGAALPVEVAHGPAAGSSQSYLDASVEGGKTYHYELVIRAAAGGEFRSQIATVSTGTLMLSLGQNHPNPFNPETTIPYDLPHSDKRERVRLWVLDIAGRIVTTLVDEDQGGGSYRVTWQGRDNRGEAVSSGVYFYVLDVGGQRRTKKLVLLK
jgi:hypothetical protein